MNQSASITWQHLAGDPKSCYKQLFIKGTRIRARVLYGLFRYLQVVYSRGGGADPAWEMLHDPHLIAATAGWLGATGWLLSG